MVRILVVLAVLVCIPAWAQSEMEIIPLRHQTADRVLPVLQPLLEPGGTLSGMNNQLFLRASPRNRQEIRKALAAIDTPLRRLVIHVSRNRGTDGAGSGASGQVVLGTARREANAQVWDTRRVQNERSDQMVQTIDGGRAFIQVGYSVPIALRQVAVGPAGAVVTDSVVYRDIGRGFYAEPHVIGDQVRIEISQQADSPGRYGAGSANVERLATTVSGRLGEWIELGGSVRQAAGEEGGGWSRSTGEVRDSRSVWLMVTEER